MYNGVYILNWYQKQPLQKKFTPVPPPRIAQSGPVSPNQGPAHRPMRGRLEEHLDHLNIREEAGGGIVWVNPSSKCASCHSNEMHQRIIHTHVNVALKAYMYDETIYNFFARARFAGCTYLRHIILALDTVYDVCRRYAGVDYIPPVRGYEFGCRTLEKTDK